MRAGITEEEISRVISYLSENPMAGEVMRGTGGCRKLRVAGRGKGKSGGYRTVTFYTGENMPVFLVALFSKGDRANLSAEERAGLAKLTKLIVAEYRRKVRPVERQDRTP